MTNEEALKKAQEKFGSKSTVLFDPTEAFCEGLPYEIYRPTNGFMDWFSSKRSGYGALVGIGKDWEEAFADIKDNFSY
jgi:hypothetical protein